jgi:hypothetical protein
MAELGNKFEIVFAGFLLVSDRKGGREGCSNPDSHTYTNVLASYERRLCSSLLVHLFFKPSRRLSF